jgi:hypothetical protein
MNEFLIFMISYLGVILIMLFVVNIITKGFLFRFLVAKFGKRKGKVILTIMTGNAQDDYDKIGTIKEGWLTYKDRDKKTRRIAVPEGAVSKMSGALWLTIDEIRNIVLTRDKKGVTGFDANKFEDLYLRALNRSKLNDYKKTLQMIGVGVVLGILFSLVGVVLLVQLKKTLLVVLSEGFTKCDLNLLTNTTIQTGANVITGGNI